VPCAEVLNALKVKGKVVPVLLLTELHAMKAYWRRGVLAPFIL
jgi:hypothetical protein